MNKKDGDKISEGVQKMKDCYGETILLKVAILCLALSVAVAFIYLYNDLSCARYGIFFILMSSKTKTKSHENQGQLQLTWHAK